MPPVMAAGAPGAGVVVCAMADEAVRTMKLINAGKWLMDVSPFEGYVAQPLR
jgi:hypothetical protein